MASPMVLAAGLAEVVGLPAGPVSCAACDDGEAGPWGVCGACHRWVCEVCIVRCGGCGLSLCELCADADLARLLRLCD